MYTPIRVIDEEENELPFELTDNAIKIYCPSNISEFRINGVSGIYDPAQPIYRRSDYWLGIDEVAIDSPGTDGYIVITIDTSAIVVGGTRWVQPYENTGKIVVEIVQ